MTKIGKRNNKLSKHYIVLLLLKDLNYWNPGIDLQNMESFTTKIIE